MWKFLRWVTRSAQLLLFLTRSAQLVSRDDARARSGQPTASVGVPKEGLALVGRVASRLPLTAQVRRRHFVVSSLNCGGNDEREKSWMASGVGAGASSSGVGEKRSREEEEEESGGVLNGPSERESLASKYTRALRKGTPSTPGILNEYNQSGEDNLPYDHQRKAVRFACSLDWGVIAHDAGLGKTATLCQLHAAVELCKRGGTSMIVSAPSSTLPQWEDTIHDWLRIPRSKVLVTNKLREVSVGEEVDRLRVLVISRDCLANAYRTCFHLVPEHEQNERGNWRSAWVPIPNAPVHPVFLRDWTVMGVDEAHYMRNPDTGWCKAHAELAKRCTQRFALTATPIYNKPKDMQGMCSAIGAAKRFCEIKFWTTDKKQANVNPMAVDALKPHISRVTDQCLGLPPIIDKVVRFNVDLDEADAILYNSFLTSARKLRMELEGQGKKKAQDLQRLMALLTKLQQLLVSPLLARRGAEAFKTEADLLEEAASRETGCLLALEREIRKLQTEEGVRRIIVAVNHVQMMRIAQRFLEKKSAEENGPDYGEVSRFDGTLTQNQRKTIKHDFLTAEKHSVLFLSIGAGGVGLHLVGKPSETTAVIFWGSSPFSPAQVWQTTKRGHRLGQEHTVHVRHLIAYGSVDYAIRTGHKDKANLARYVIDGDKKALGEMGELALAAAQAMANAANGSDVMGGATWKQMGRYVDVCEMMEATGNFPREPTEHEVRRERAMAAMSNSLRAPPVPLNQGFPICRANVEERLQEPQAGTLLAQASQLSAGAVVQLPPL